MKIACLHTAASNITVFDAAVRQMGMDDVVLTHLVNPELLSRVEEAGGMIEEVASQTRAILRTLAQTADAVVLTCSTLGPIVNTMRYIDATPILRVDAALAEQTMNEGGKIVVLYASPTTIGPTKEIFAEAAQAAAISFEMRSVPEAWEYFKAGDQHGYFVRIAEAADTAYSDGATVVALAQASMAGAVAFIKSGTKPLTSPMAGLLAAVSRVGAGSRIKDQTVV